MKLEAASRGIVRQVLLTLLASLEPGRQTEGAGEARRVTRS